MFLGNLKQWSEDISNIDQKTSPNMIINAPTIQNYYSFHKFRSEFKGFALTF